MKVRLLYLVLLGASLILNTLLLLPKPESDYMEFREMLSTHCHGDVIVQRNDESLEGLRRRVHSDSCVIFVPWWQITAGEHPVYIPPVHMSDDLHNVMLYGGRFGATTNDRSHR